MTNKRQKCEIRGCKSGKPGTIAVHEIIGDGSWRVLICKDCAKRMGLKENDNLPTIRP